MVRGVQSPAYIKGNTKVALEGWLVYRERNERVILGEK
jgi:hypothetical protein